MINNLRGKRMVKKEGGSDQFLRDDFCVLK
jgi:hypothetical protein